MPEHPNLHTALAAVQGKLPDVTKGHVADAGKYKYAYASLHDVHEAVLPALSAAGLSWTCTVDVEPPVLVGALTHGTTGEVVTSRWPLPKTIDSQQLGKAVSYGRRYLLLGVVGIAPADDDDGEGVVSTPQGAQVPDRTDREHVADLVLEHVPHEHVGALCDAYQSGAATLDEVDDANIARMRRALSSRGSRDKVLAGVAERVNPTPEPEPEPAGPDGDHGISTGVLLTAQAQVSKALRNGVSLDDANALIASMSDDVRGGADVTLGSSPGAVKNLPHRVVVALAADLSDGGAA